MNKKFLSAILFGALMVTSTGTFVSCKDYDDEIDNLQEQIDNLATKSDVETKLSQLQAAIDAAKAESAANAAKIAALTKCECDVDAMMKKIQDAVDADMAEYKAEIEALVEEVEALVGKVADFVTSVELLVSNPAEVNTGYDDVLKFSTAIEKENVFSKDINNAITFVKNAEVQTPDQFLVRVSPANAVLTEEMISLVNSKGENLDELVEVVEVKKFESLLTKAATNNGLWIVKTQLKAYGDGKAFAAAKAKDGKDIVYAVQVNNSISAAEARYVTSTYDLTLDWEKFEADAVLNYKVDDVKVETLANRIADEENSPELTWKGDAAVEATADNVEKNKDKRLTGDYALAVQGKELTISLYETITLKDGTKKDIAPKDVRAIYVTLDKKANAYESAPSEWNAWNGYTYTGLNTVVEGTSTKITINSDKAINDVIGFRVYAVNYDGTLVDPDGKAFYALVGKQADDWSVAATTIVPDADSSNAPSAEKSNTVAVTTTELTAPYSWSWAVDKDNVPFSIALVDKDGNVMKGKDNVNAIFDHSTTWEGTNLGNFKFENIKGIYTIPAAGKAWTDYEDDKAYIGTFTVKNANGFVLATIRVSMTKKLPTAIPDGFTFKDKQVINGIYNCYMEATEWDATNNVAGTASSFADGMMKIENFINFGKGLAGQYNLTFATSAADANEDGVLDNVTAVGSGYVNVKKAYVDNTTEHASKIEYNFGKISSVKFDGAYVDYKITAAEFKTVWCCFYKSDVHTWDWATRAQLGGDYNTLIDATKPELGYKADPLSTSLIYGSYPDDPATTGVVEGSASYEGMIFGKNDIDGTFSKTLDKVYENSLVVKKAELISDATEKADYFTVSTDLKFTAIKTDIGSNPKADVPSTLIITCEDYYGHEVVIKLCMTVKPRK